MNRHARGFTLIEVLLATVLLVAGLALAFATLRRGQSHRRARRGAWPNVASACVRSRASCAGASPATRPVAFAFDQGTAVPMRFVGEPDRMRFVADLPDYLGRGGPYLHDFTIEGDGDDTPHHAGAEHGAGRRDHRGERTACRRSCWSKDCARRASATARWTRTVDWATGWSVGRPAKRLPLLVEVTLVDRDGRAWPPLVVSLPLAAASAPVACRCRRYEHARCPHA